MIRQSQGLTCILDGSLESHQSNVVFSVDRSVVEALVWNDLIDLVDACWIAAVASSALAVELQVVVAESDVLTGKGFF